jgi:predicted Zn-dependent peptidase
MKLLDSWKDKRYGSTNKLYELKNKTKFFHTIKPEIKDFDVHILFKGGSYFEKQLGLPNGTAHFLEHMLMNPNGVLKTPEALRQFEFGSRNRPEIFRNAATWQKLIGFEAGCHIKGATRALEYLSFIIKYPLERFEEFYTIEKEVILAEEKRLYKTEKDTWYNYNKFMLDTIYPEFTDRVIGSENTINSITIEDLKKYHENVFTADNCIISIQSPEKLTVEQLNIIEAISQSLHPKQNKLKAKIKKPNNFFNHKHFKYDNTQGVMFSFNKFKEMSTVPDYNFNVSFYIFRNLLSYLGYNYLRDEKGLIYGINSIWNNMAWKTYVQGFSLTFDKKNLEKVLSELEYLFETKINEFLNSKQGKKWFESQISKYIYITTVNYDANYAQSISIDIILNEKFYKYDFEESVKHAKKYTLEDFIVFANSFLKDEKPHIWFESPFEDQEILEVFEKSELFKRFNG